jgi:CubicO group peptidase (beta-lactamase class C family)
VDHSHAHGDEELARIVGREIIDGGVASSAAVGIASHREIRSAEVLAHDVVAPAVFDLASLSKPLTAVAIARAVADGRLAFATRVGEVLPEARDLPASGCTIAELLSHRAGLPAWGALYRRDPWAERVPISLAPDEEPSLESILRRAASRVGHVGAEIYSDIGYVLLGAIVERVTGARLATLWRSLTGIGGAPRDNARTPPTEIVDWRGTVRGVVHDENAAMIERAGGSPGHAGAFATIDEVLGFALRYLDTLAGRDAMLPQKLAEQLIDPIAGGTHTLGWDLRSGASPSSGAHFGPRTFGHLGFTGTSLWIDPEAEVAIALLTNRTYPARDNARIRAARPRVHDAVWAARR